MRNTPATILVVDDDPSLLRPLRMLLEQEGYRVVAAESGERALTLLGAERPNLLITDVRMGGMDGLALFAAARRMYPMLPVVILTAHGTIPDAVDATRRGVCSYLTKPYKAHALLAEIERALVQDAPNGESGTADDTQIVTRSPLMRALLDEARAVATSDASLLIQGPTGSGKELLAQTIHDWSARRAGPFVGVNCGAIPETLLESELFGHVKGAFSGAVRDHRGLFQSAHGGSILLDEVGDMPLALQVKLLRVLQQREVRPVGAAQPIPVDVRLIAATHHDLEADVAAGRFREDLYYRLNVVNLVLPPLSARREDIPLLAQQFLRTLGAKYRKSVNGISREAMDLLLCAPWSGNVRQLFNVMEKCVALSTTPIVPPALVERALNRPADDRVSFDEARRAFERDYLVRLLKMTGGNVSHAARLAQRNRSDFYTLLNRHQIDPGAFKSG
jgi:two-component system response regulator GlrR